MLLGGEPTVEVRLRPPVTLDQLIVLDAVAREGSFAAAAQVLHRVPSAVSYAIKGLEDALGVSLFDRTGRIAVLTPAGRRLLGEAREVLSRVSTVEQLASQLRGDWEPELHVVVDGALPLAPVLDALETLSRPEIPTRIRLDVEYQEGVAERFEADRAHVALHLGFDPGDDTTPFVVHPLSELPFDLVVAAQHPLAGRENPPRDLVSQYAEIIVRDSSSRYYRSPKRSFLGSQHVLYVGDFHTKRIALLAGGGFGWCPRHLIGDDLARGRLVPLTVEGRASWTYQPRLMHRRGTLLGRAARAFVAAVTHQDSRTLPS